MLYEKEIKIIEDMYKIKGKEIARNVLIESAISEIIVMKKGIEMVIKIDYNDVDKTIAKLRDEHNNLYNIAIEQYGDENKYRSKLYNKYL